jgi:leucyl-tRNA---protein transferase
MAKFEINEYFHVPELSPESLDQFLSYGFRHFGSLFYRYTDGLHDLQFVDVLPLRIVLNDFILSNSQKRTLKKNKDLKCYFEPLRITPEIEQLFYNHVYKFDENIPDSIYTFLGAPGTNPTKIMQCIVRDEEKLVAASFLDVGARSTSSIYGMFDLNYSKRRLGIYTMLQEISYSQQNNMVYYYPGYAYKQKSFYDYKKTFHAMEYLDWQKILWLPFPRLID